MSIGLDFKYNAIYKSKNIQSDMNYVLQHERERTDME